MQKIYESTQFTKQQAIKLTTNSKHKYLIVANVLNREFAVTEPSKAWVSDINYIKK
jgi:transposase InsO family protein